MDKIEKHTTEDLLKKISILSEEKEDLAQRLASLEEQLRENNQTRSDDLIARKDAKLVKYNNELEQFTYVATHDLKTPLANIQGYLSLLEMDIENPNADVLDSLKWLKYSVGEAKNVIQELTHALRARNNKEELRKKINLDDLVEGILSGMRARILNNKIVFISDFTEINDFSYYPVALRSILQNIISNAIEYSSKTEHPEIIVQSLLIGKEVHISIQDNGVGINLEMDGEKLFGLFKRVQNDGSGSGIGMYIVNKLLENYGGRLAVESEVGKGSTFTVVIPYEKA